MIKKGKVIKGSIDINSHIGGNVSKASNIYIKELEFNNHFEFPDIGEDGKLYIAKDENSIYRFDIKKNIYICISRDYMEIEVIQGIL